MAIDRANDPRAFRSFLDIQLSSGGECCSLDELLALWEYENAPVAEREETLRSIRRGHDDMNDGRTTDAFEFVERMRRKIQAAPER